MGWISSPENGVDLLVPVNHAPRAAGPVHGARRRRPGGEPLNVIHYMHDKYACERIEMALHDHPVHRFMACGIAGLSVAADSLSAVKYARVKVIRDDTGLAVDYETEGDYPAYGNNDDRVDSIAVGLVTSFRGGRLRALGRQAPLRAGARRHLADDDDHSGGLGARVR